MDIEKIKAAAKRHQSLFIEQDEIINEAVICCLEKGVSEEQAVEICYKKLRKDSAKHDLKKAKSIYNEDGECLDDNYYFVDPKTVEQYGERKGISDDLREKGLKVAHTMNLLNHVLWRFTKRKRPSEYRRFSRFAFMHYQMANHNKEAYNRLFCAGFSRYWGERYAKH